MAILLAVFTEAAKGFNHNGQRDSLDLAKLKMSLVYVKSINTFRLLFMSLLGIGVCLILLISGIILLHTILFLYMPWSIETKIYAGLSLIGVYFFTAFNMCSYIFSQEKWLKIFHADCIVENLAPQSSSENSGEDKEGDSGSGHKTEGHPAASRL